MLNILRTTSDNPHFVSLVALLDFDLKVRDGDDHPFYDQFNKITGIKNALVAYLDEKPVGCGAFKPYSDTQVEVKRMYTLPEYRGKGIAQAILTELETWAAELNYTESILETGKMQPEAIKLYAKAGYTIMPNYGQYTGVDNSVCFAKAIRAGY